jgi:hypothetical protein
MLISSVVYAFGLPTISFSILRKSFLLLPECCPAIYICPSYVPNGNSYRATELPLNFGVTGKRLPLEAKVVLPKGVAYVAEVVIVAQNGKVSFASL